VPGLSDDDWSTLVARIRDKECTPFIGAGASAGIVPLAAELAREWARAHDYPLTDTENLARVAQFIAIEQDPIRPRELLRERLRQIVIPDVSNPDDPHAVLAALELPLYLTTNYDGLMFAALRGRGKDCQRELCAWNDLIAAAAPSLLTGDFTPTPEQPLVYHLHGYYEVPHSLVLTEDDYLTFLVRISKDNTVRLLPSAIRTALASTSLLFVGYSLADWDFRVLFRGLIGSLGGTVGTTNIAVQLEPKAVDGTPEGRERALKYLRDYFEKIQTVKVRVYWGDAKDFGRELSERWRDYRTRGR
jgi:hypothetical protein